MEIELRKTSDIKPYDQNPRQNDQAVEAVARSIQEFGFRQPIVVDEQGVIIVGHTRWKAAKKLGLETVPVHVAVGLTPKQTRAYRIADNKSADNSTWDPALLPLELADLKEMDFDLGLLGFSDDELATLLGEDVKEGETDPDAVPEPPDEATTQPGDLWILGDHRLLCADSARAEDVDRLLDGATIHLVNTDPPYNVKVEPRSNNAIAAGNSDLRASSRDARRAQRSVRADVRAVGLGGLPAVRDGVHRQQTHVPTLAGSGRRERFLQCLRRPAPTAPLIQVFGQGVILSTDSIHNRCIRHPASIAEATPITNIIPVTYLRTTP